MNIGFLVAAIVVFLGLCGVGAWFDINDSFDEIIPAPVKLLLFMIVVSVIIALILLAFK